MRRSIATARGVGVPFVIVVGHGDTVVASVVLVGVHDDGDGRPEYLLLVFARCTASSMWDVVEPTLRGVNSVARAKMSFHVRLTSIDAR